MWADFDLLREREAEAIRGMALAVNQGYAGARSKEGSETFGKWLDELG